MVEQTLEDIQRSIRDKQRCMERHQQTIKELKNDKRKVTCELTIKWLDETITEFEKRVERVEFDIYKLEKEITKRGEN